MRGVKWQTVYKLAASGGHFACSSICDKEGDPQGQQQAKYGASPQ